MTIQIFIRFVALLFVLYFDFIFFYIQIINPEYSYKENLLSKYVNKRKGMLLKIAFVLFGIAEILLFLVLDSKNAINGFLLLLSGIGIFIAGLFDGNLYNKKTIKTNIHLISAFMQLAFFPIYMITLFVFPLENINRILILTLGIISAIFGIALFCIYSFNQNLKNQIIGIIQKSEIFVISLGLKYIIVFSMKS